jgi:hypothetical protein
MPGVGHVGCARAALQMSQRRPAPAPRVGAHPHDPLPLRRLSLAAPPRQWLVPLARAARGPGQHAAGIAPPFVRVPARHLAVATPDRPAAEPRRSRPSELSRRARRGPGSGWRAGSQHRPQMRRHPGRRGAQALGVGQWPNPLAVCPRGRRVGARRGNRGERWGAVPASEAPTLWRDSAPLPRLDDSPSGGR